MANILSDIGNYIGEGLSAVRQNQMQKLAQPGIQNDTMATRNILNRIEAAGGLNTPAGQQIAIEEIEQRYPQFKGKFSANSLISTPPGVTPEKMAEFNSATVDAGIRQAGAKVDPLTRLETITKLAEGNTDATTGKTRDKNVAKYLSGEVSKITGVQSDATGQPKITLADMLGDKPQSTARKGWWIFGDDTISPVSVKVATDDYVKRLQLDEGLSRDDARKRAALEYDELTANDTGMLQRYPKMDVSRLFMDEDSRKQAISDGNSVVDTGDGVQTTPKKMADLGIQDVNTQEQFQALEGMVGKALPDVDLRADYQKDPQFYQQLFKAIKEGVSDNKGGKRKLSMQEIISLIKGE